MQLQIIVMYMLIGAIANLQHRLWQNEEWREKFRKRLECNGLMLQNSFGIVALEAAYNHRSEAWLSEIMAYVEANYKFMAAYMAEHLPQSYNHPAR